MGGTRAARCDRSNRRDWRYRSARSTRCCWSARFCWTDRSDRLDGSDRPARITRNGRSSRSTAHVCWHLVERNDLHVGSSSLLQWLDIHFAGERQHRKRAGHEPDVVVTCRAGIERAWLRRTSRSDRPSRPARSTRHSRRARIDWRDRTARRDRPHRPARATRQFPRNMVDERNIQYRRRRIFQRLRLHLTRQFEYKSPAR